VQDAEAQEPSAAVRRL